MPKNEFKEFILNELAAILYMMNQISSKVFIPIAVVQSVVMPDSEVTVTLRNSTNVKNIPLSGWFTTNIPQLCKMLIVRQINFSLHAGDLQRVSDFINQELVQINKS